MIEQIIGEIRLFCGNYAPEDWAFCNGQLLQVAQYGALFSIIGTAYGGDGRTTFALPDFRGRIPVGVTEPSKRGQKGGSETASLRAEHLPAHTHSLEVLLNVSNATGTLTTPVGNYPAKTGSFDKEYNTASDTSMKADMVELTLKPTGQGAPFNLMQPAQVVNFIIALEGNYPQRWD
ncbi:MAG: phage tail protein [Bacteroidetes Order II. Incertae sedis bacterium]|nr:phage tail protein [Bacteroidetes Order II. bacterium]